MPWSAGELLGHGILFEFAAEFDGDVGHVTDATDAVAGFDSIIRIFAGHGGFWRKDTRIQIEGFNT